MDAVNGARRHKVSLADLNNKGRARAWFNDDGDGTGFREIGEIAPGPDEDLSASEVVFSDVNGDGYDDYLIIFHGGAVKVYLNTGNIDRDTDGRLWAGA